MEFKILNETSVEQSTMIPYVDMVDFQPYLDKVKNVCFSLNALA